MSTGYRDLSGNNPTHIIGDTAETTTMPAVRIGAPIDPTSADVDFNVTARALYIGVSGIVEIVDPTGTSRILPGLVAGSIVDIQCKGTRAAGSATCTSVVPLY